MKKTLFFALFMICSVAVWSHNPQISTAALIKGKDNTWSLMLSSGLLAFQYELKNSYPTQHIDNLNADEFQRKIIDHLKDKINIKANGEAVSLTNGMIRFGHQTDIRFEVTGMPKDLSSLDFQHLGFGTLKQHYCVLKLITNENEPKQFILQNDNLFSVYLEAANGILVERPKQTSNNRPVIIALGLMAGFVFLLLYARFRSRSPFGMYRKRL